jgi:hypothetical protein
MEIAVAMPAEAQPIGIGVAVTVAAVVTADVLVMAELPWTRAYAIVIVSKNIFAAATPDVPVMLGKL